MLTPDAGYFWFFEPGNVELTVKLLDGCAVNGARWFFAAGLTNLGIRVTVADLTDGSQRVYSSAPGQPFQPVMDTAAFATCGGELASRDPEEPSADGFATPLSASYGRPGAAGFGCSGSDTELCLEGRFRIEADWQTASGRSGVAHAVPIAEESGYFWFFDADNIELVVKTLDACSIHRGRWFFGAGMTRVGVQVRVTDTFTGDVQTYANPVNVAFAPIQDTAAFAYCPTSTPTPTPSVTGSPVHTPTPSATPPVSGTPTVTAPPGQTHTVTIVKRGIFYAFLPESLHVRAGDTVRWALRYSFDGSHHRSASVTHLWDSGPAGPNFFDHTFTTTGTFAYECGLDSHFQGQIIVDP